MLRSLPLALFCLISQGCLVLTLNPSHERHSLVWEPELLGEWQNTDDNSSVKITRAEWQSYTIEYTHPIETGRLTAYLTTIGDARYLDVMPARGEDRGSFLIPVHATLRVVLEGNRLEVTALSYDWFSDRLRTRAGVAGLSAALDEKENAVIVSPTDQVRAWLRKQPRESSAFGASAVFVRKQAP